MKFYIDEKLNDKIGVHPNDNSATIWLKISDLIDIIKKHGNEVHVIKI